MKQQYSFLQEFNNSTQYNFINEGFLRDFLKFDTMCKRAEILRNKKNAEWIKQIKKLRFLLKNKKISKNIYEIELDKIHDNMSKLELRLSKLNLLPVYK